MNLRQLFAEVDRNGNGFLTESELTRALVNADYSRFDRETVRLMIRMFDRTRRGMIQFEEFKRLWQYLHRWKNIFDKFDMDRSGTISQQEFATAITAFGYHLSPQVVQSMFGLYSRVDRNGMTSMSFDLFVQACINLKHVTDVFKKYDTDRDGYVTFSFEMFALEVLSLK